MKHLPTFVIVLLWPFLSWSQVNPTGQVHGRILDADTRLPLFGASVALILARDSSMSSFSALSSESGGFWISGVTADRYRLYISYLGYQPLLVSRVIDVDGKSIALGDVLLNKKGLTLRQVEIITSKSPFIVKRDTIEYNTDFYKTRETSPMEDLLRKLPGVEITPDGIIKVNGQVVDHVLIDGKPFFGTDTRQATQNLLIKIIDKIQVIDRVPDLSDQAVPSNNKVEKALNIILKKEEHNKIGGVANAGLGYKNRFSVKTSLNRFREKQQISLIGGGNNVNEFENNNFVPNNLLRSWKAGLNFNQDLGQKLTIGISYNWNKIRSDASSNSYRQNILPDSTLISTNISQSQSQVRLHSVSLNLTYKLDSMSHLVLANAFSIRSRESVSEKSYNTKGPTSLINDGSLLNNQDGGAVFQLTSLNYTKRFRKQGQLLKVGMNYSINDNRDEIHTVSDTWYQLSRGLREKDSLNQLVNSQELGSTYKLNIWYAHPLKNHFFVDFSLGGVSSAFKTKKATSNFNSDNGKFDSVVDSLSGKTRNNTTVSNTSISLRLDKERYDLSIGVNGFLNSLDGWLKDPTDAYRKKYSSISPTVTLNYRINHNKKFHFDYIQNMQAPEPTQLFLIPDYSNPLFLQKGNPNLKPTRIDLLNVHYSTLNPRTMKSLSVQGILGLIKDQVLAKVNYDSIGRQISIPVNVNGTYFYGLSVYNSFRMGKKLPTLNTSTIINFGKEFTSVNSELIQVSKSNVMQGVNFSWRYEKLLDLAVYGTLSYFNVKYTGNSQMNTYYFETLISLVANINLPHGMVFESSQNYTATSGRADGYNNNRMIWNMGVTKNILQDGNGMLKLQCFDALNQNVNVVRNTGVGYIEDVRSVSMKRFLMFSFVYYIK